MAFLSHCFYGPRELVMSARLLKEEACQNGRV